MTRPAEHFTVMASANPAVICGDKTFSYTQFLNAVSTAEHDLRNSGIRKDDRVGILSHNSPDYLIALFALWHIGAAACLLSTRLPDKARHEQLRSMNCRHFLTSTDLARISKTRRKVKTEDKQEFHVPFDRDATIMFTSGTSSKPKAVLHTFGNHYYSAKGSNEHLPVVPGDQWFLSLPLYHTGGLGIIFRAFLGGGSVVIPEANESIENAITKHKITHLSLVSTQFIRLIRNQNCHSILKGLKVILVGGSAVPDSVLEDAVKLGLPVYTTYGSTEMASQVATSNRLSDENRISSGRVLNYRELMISEEGEILIKGETLFKGYIEGSRLTLPFNKNGYFAAGDIGDFLDNGNLIVKGRKDNMFISGGENIQPEEIERYLYRIKSIEHAVVVPAADEEFGFRPAAFIKTNEILTQAGIRNTLQNDLPKFKIPEQFYLWPENADTSDFKANRHYFANLITEQPTSLTSIT